MWRIDETIANTACIPGNLDTGWPFDTRANSPELRVNPPAGGKNSLVKLTAICVGQIRENSRAAFLRISLHVLTGRQNGVLCSGLCELNSPFYT